MWVWTCCTHRGHPSLFPSGARGELVKDAWIDWVALHKDCDWVRGGGRGGGGVFFFWGGTWAAGATPHLWVSRITHLCCYQASWQEARSPNVDFWKRTSYQGILQSRNLSCRFTVDPFVQWSAVIWVSCLKHISDQGGTHVRGGCVITVIGTLRIPTILFKCNIRLVSLKTGNCTINALNSLRCCNNVHRTQYYPLQRAIEWTIRGLFCCAICQIMDAPSSWTQGTC